MLAFFRLCADEGLKAIAEQPRYCAWASLPAGAFLLAFARWTFHTDVVTTVGMSVSYGGTAAYAVAAISTSGGFALLASGSAFLLNSMRR